MRAAWRNRPRGERLAAAYARAAEICDEDVAINQAIGRHGLKIIREIAATKAKGAPVNILTHCNAGWLATVDWGTATAPMYLSFEEGIPLHVWADEPRPRNQGDRKSTPLNSSHYCATRMPSTPRQKTPVEQRNTNVGQ